MYRKSLIMRKVLITALTVSPIFLMAQDIKVIKFPELQKRILTADAPLTVFNFWATWCGPCVKEIPHFETYASNPNVKVVFVSMDFSDELEKVKKFVKNQELKSEVVLLDETDYNTIIDKISKDWSGAIPATLFVDEWGKTNFHEKEFTKEQLDNTINEYLN